MFRAAIDVAIDVDVDDVDVGGVDDLDGFLGGGAMLSYSQLCMLTIVYLTLSLEYKLTDWMDE